MPSFTGDSGRDWRFDEGSPIGAPGGFGEVFRGEGTGGEAVAVKRVRLRIGDEAERRRRGREVEIADLLAQQQPLPWQHLLVPLDRGFIGEDLLIVMPLASASLDSALRDGSLQADDRIPALREVILGLNELAEAGVLHRDLKPANVLLVEGAWKLADFGIARNLAEATGTYTFRGAGTMPYMAPELWNGQPATVKSDLYALGVLAFEVLMGVRPFNGPGELEYREQHASAPPPQLGNVDAGVARLVLRLLAKDAASRPQDARAALEALDVAGRALSIRQEALQRAALQAEQRRSVAQAAGARQRTDEEIRDASYRQAIADLDALLNQALDSIRDVLPETELTTNGTQWSLRSDGVSVEVRTWRPRWADLNRDDPAACLGVVVLNGSRSPRANVVCERAGDRLEWFTLEFLSSPLVGGNYRLGPVGERHGFGEQAFYSERPRMLRPVMHVWTMNRAPLNADRFLDLLLEAIG